MGRRIKGKTNIKAKETFGSPELRKSQKFLRTKLNKAKKLQIEERDQLRRIEFEQIDLQKEKDVETKRQILLGLEFENKKLNKIQNELKKAIQEARKANERLIAEKIRLNKFVSKEQIDGQLLDKKLHDI